MILLYIYSIIFRKENLVLKTIEEEVEHTEDVQSKGFFSSFMKKTVEITTRIVERYASPTHCLVDDGKYL